MELWKGLRNVDVGARLKFVRKLQLLLGYPWLETLANAGWH